jgi:LysM repeat protein
MGGINLAGLDVIKENIEYERLFSISSSDAVLKGEYLIPDTHPDVVRILTVEAKPVITNKEVVQERVYVEGQLEYNVIYLAKEDEGLGVHTITYSDKFANYIDVAGAEHRMVCDAESEVEHINSNIINERKVSLECIFSTKCTVYKKDNFEFVKDIEGSGDIEVKKKVEAFDKLVYEKGFDLSTKASLQIGMDKPQIGKIIKINVQLHKKEIKALDGRVQVACYCKLDLLYKASDSRELVPIEDDLFLTKEEDAESVSSTMITDGEFRVTGTEYNISQDDLGEARTLDIEVLLGGQLKVYSKDDLEIIEDAYSPVRNMELKKDDVEMSVLHGQGNNETIIKDNLEPEGNSNEPLQILSTTGEVVSLENKIVENKVVIDGIVNVNVIYKTADTENNVANMKSEIPFTTTVDIQDIKDNMKSVVKAWIESLQASIEAHTIAIKAVINASAKVYLLSKKQYISEVEEKEGEVEGKKASITIYSVQKHDTLWTLAKKFNTTMGELLKINNLEGPDSICVNQKLIIPGRAVI